MRSDSKLRRSTLVRGAAAAVLVAGFSAGFGMTSAQAAQHVTLVETGSSLLYPLFNEWAPAFEKTHPHIKITTQSTGSGTGISQAVAGLVQIGSSDAYMPDAQMKQHPEIMNIPLAISAQAINYNVPGLNGKHIHLSGPVLAAIYMGDITKWNDPKIEKMNPGMKLPDHKIIPVHRTDGSGDTFLFSQFLSFTTPAWKDKLGYSTTVSWPPVKGELGAEGNQGMIKAIESNKYSIAYIGISYFKQVAKAGLGQAALENKAGNFVLPTKKTITSAAAGLSAKTPKDERISLIYAEGKDSYPIINYEYAIVSKKQPNEKTAKALKTMLKWAIHTGNEPKFLNQVEFKPLPKSIKKLSMDQIEMISH